MTDYIRVLIAIASQLRAAGATCVSLHLDVDRPGIAVTMASDADVNTLAEALNVHVGKTATDGSTWLRAEHHTEERRLWIYGPQVRLAAAG